MILAWLLLLTGLTISAVAIYYSVVGLAAIFSAAVIPIIVMGTTLEVAKLVCASWLKANWERAPSLLKTYMSIAVVVLMLITSMGIFGFLSKAHNDQNLVSGDVQGKIAIYDEKIKTAKDNIEANRKALAQMDAAVDQTMSRSTTEGGADKAVAIRRSQAKERARLQSEIAAEQKTISKLNEEAAPIRAEVRKVEAEVGPIKYIAKFIYGDDPDTNILEKAVTWVIILIVVVFDPLAVIMLLAAQMTFGWKRDSEYSYTPDPYVADVGEKPVFNEIPEWEKDSLEEKAEGNSLTTEGGDNIVEEATVTKQFVDHGEHPKDTLEYKHTEVPLTEPATDQGGEQTAQEEQLEQDIPVPVEQWNKLIEEAERAVEEENKSVVEAEARRYVPEEQPEEDSKKKTYMTKTQEGKLEVKVRR